MKHTRQVFCKVNKMKRKRQVFRKGNKVTHEQKRL